jgi:4'-phosphopantetheinyl transferase
VGGGGEAPGDVGSDPGQRAELETPTPLYVGGPRSGESNLGELDRKVQVFHLEDSDRPAGSAGETVLSEGERRRATAFRFEQDRRLFVRSHLLLRAVLSRYADIPPERWIFSTTEHGKPRIVRSEGVPPLEFSLSHTRGLAVCAVGRGRALGVDAENLERMIGFPEVAERVCSPTELRTLSTIPSALRPTRFFEYWTLKESLLKAMGIGLAGDPATVTFRLGAGTVEAWFDPGWPETPARWQFALYRPTSRHVVAVSVGVDEDAVGIQLREAVLCNG